MYVSSVTFLRDSKYLLGYLSGLKGVGATQCIAGAPRPLGGRGHGEVLLGTGCSAAPQGPLDTTALAAWTRESLSTETSSRVLGMLSRSNSTGSNLPPEGVRVLPHQEQKLVGASPIGYHQEREYTR